MKKRGFKMNSPFRKPKGRPDFKKILPFTGTGGKAMLKSTAIGAGLGILGSKIFPKAFTPVSGALVGGGIASQIDLLRQSKWKSGGKPPKSDKIKTKTKKVKKGKCKDGVCY